MRTAQIAVMDHEMPLIVNPRRLRALERATPLLSFFEPTDVSFSLSIPSLRSVVSSSRDSQGWLQAAGTRSGRGRNVRESPRALRPGEEMKL